MPCLVASGDMLRVPWTYSVIDTKAVQYILYILRKRNTSLSDIMNDDPRYKKDLVSLLW